MKSVRCLFHICMVAVLVLFTACDEDLSVERSSVALHVGETVALKIEHASGNCMVEVVKPAIVNATVNEEGKLELFAKDEGNAIIRLTDSQNEVIEIQVISTLDLNGMWLIKGKDSYKCFAYAQDVDVAGNIWNQLEEKNPFSIGKRYVFVQKGGSEKPGVNMVPVYYQFKDGKLTVEIEENGEYSCTIIQWTEKELVFQEDLTEYFRSLYPDAGVSDVKRKIVWARYYDH